MHTQFESVISCMLLFSTGPMPQWFSTQDGPAVRINWETVYNCCASVTGEMGSWIVNVMGIKGKRKD